MDYITKTAQWETPTPYEFTQKNIPIRPHPVNVDYLDEDIIKYFYNSTYVLTQDEVKHNKELGFGPNGLLGSQDKYIFPPLRYSVTVNDAYTRILPERLVMDPPPPVSFAKRKGMFLVGLSLFSTDLSEYSVDIRNLEPIRPYNIQIGVAVEVYKRVSTAVKDKPLCFMDRASKAARVEELKIIKYQAYTMDICNTQALEQLRRMHRETLSRLAPPPIPIVPHLSTVVKDKILKVKPKKLDKLMANATVIEYDTEVLHIMEYKHNYTKMMIKRFIKASLSNPHITWENHELHILSHYWKAKQEEFYLLSLMDVYKSILESHNMNKWQNMSMPSAPIAVKVNSEEVWIHNGLSVLTPYN